MLKTMMAAAAAGLLLAGPALADPSADPTARFEVKTGGVHFNDPAQVEALLHRIHAKASDACSTPLDDTLALYDPTIDKRCVDKAVADAVHAINQPVLTASFDTSPASANRALAGNDQ